MSEFAMRKTSLLKFLRKLIGFSSRSDAPLAKLGHAARKQYPAPLGDISEEDYDDASEAVYRVTEALRLAGVDTGAISDALFSRAIMLQLAEGVKIDEIIDDVEVRIAALTPQIWR